MHFPSVQPRSTSAKGRIITSLAVTTALALAGLMSGGCDVKSFIDPSEMGRYKFTPLQKPILTSLSSIDRSIDDPDVTFVNATDPLPKDLEVIGKDYLIGKGDLVQVSVTDVVMPGVETTKSMCASESGNISLPLIGQVHAEGLTEAQLEQAIIDAYRNADLIQRPQVSVTVTEARVRTFSALGAFGQPGGPYPIVESNFRMLDALAEIHDVGIGVENIYVIRQVSEDPDATPKAESPAATPTTPPPTTPQPGGDNLAPRSEATPVESERVALLQTTGDVTPTSKPSTQRVYTPPVVQPFQFAAPQGPEETRVIRIPVDPLHNGVLNYNIVIRPHDMMMAPNPVTGEFYMGGHIARPGVFSLTARKITLKEAIIAAGMLDGVAIPQRTDLIRRIGPDREVFARINLDAIFAGTQPDIYLKPYDSVMVGTNFLAPFIAAVRGGFRISYGFGFVYDRNYAPTQNQG